MTAQPDEPSLVSLDELQSWIGREHEFAGVDEVTRNDIRRKLEVYCFDCPLHYSDEVARAHGYRGLVAPVAMTPLWAMPAYWTPGQPVPFAPGAHENSGGIRTDLPTAYPRGVNTATEWEYFEPLYPGDALEGNWRLIEIKPRQTRIGDGLFLTVETTIFKRTGELVAKNRNTGYRYEPKAADVPREKREKPAAESGRLETAATIEPADWGRQLRLGDVAVGDEVPPFSMWLSHQCIVMSVAADRMFGGLHHNRDKARAGGFADVIFNTRSYEMLFETMLRRWIGLDGRIAKLGPFRMTGSSYPDDLITARARVVDKEQHADKGSVKIEILVLNNRGDAVRGEAQVTLPP